MSTPATAEQYLESVVRSGLLSHEQLRPYAHGTAGDGPEGHRALANRLVKNRLLTPFQARQLLAGKTRGFFLAGKYKILALIGTGGMGQVFLCEHLVLQRLVAVKLLQRAVADGSAGGQAAALERFVREARAVAALDHPNIVRVHDMDRAGATPFMVMEYVDGTSLHQVVAGHGPLAVNRAADSIRQAACGLQHAHEHGLVHRDIKPGNLLLDRAGTVKLLDLGLARFLRDTARNGNVTARYNDDHAVVGTADYMSPEQALNSTALDIRSDLYSLGATFYYLLAGKAPFEGEFITQKLVAHQFRDPVAIRSLRRDVPEELAAVLARMMAKNPNGRYPTPASVVAALRPWTGSPIPPPPPAEMPRLTPAAYRLGLAPGPATPTSVRDSASEAAWEFALAPDSQEARTETPRTAHDRTPVPPADEQPEPTAPLPSSIQRGAARPPVGIARFFGRLTPARLAVALGLVLLLAGGVWWWRSTLDRPTGERPDAQTPPTPPPPTGLVITGSGSTFIKPAMDHWAPLYEQQSGVKIKYDGIGSGRGVDNMVDKVLDFGCTDAAMTDAQLTKARAAGGEVVHIPLALGAVVATYNLPDVSGQLRFTGPVLADIFLGKIRKWNHDAIAASNPSVTLPDLEITVIRRSDVSGTTFIWTDYLKKASAEWDAKVGVGTTVKWPVGEDAEKNDGVAKGVSRKIGAIGYVELSFALERNLKFARVKNQNERYIEPSLESVTAAANAALRIIPPDLRFTLTDAPGEDSYPIAGTAWAVVYVNQPGAKGKELVKFLRWAVHDGQTHLRQLRYAPLPPSLVARIDEKLAAIQTGD